MTQPRQPPPTQHARKRSPIPWLIFAVLVVVAGIVVVPKLLDDNSANTGPEPVAAEEQDPLLLAVQRCDPAKKDVKLSDGNRKLTVTGAGEKSTTGLSESGLTCVFEALQMPGQLSERMYSTVAADLQLEGEWPGFTVTWTNDKVKGLKLTVTRS